MKTQIFTDDLTGAAEILKNGGLVAVPTETVYGLAGSGKDEKAVKQIYDVKGRPPIKPLSLMIPGKESIPDYCDDVPEQAYTLADAFWPGPLTIVLKAKKEIPDIVLAGGTTVGLRCPDHPMTLELLRLSGVPFAAPSANPSGEESPKDAQKVASYFDGKIEGIVDGGPCGIGKESTLISLAAKPYKILRQGALSRERITEALVGAMKIIGVTGGSGCGKTTALKVFEQQGAAVIDCDSLYHSMLESDEVMLSELRGRFPGGFTDGKADRAKLRAAVFNNHSDLNDLNRITHTHIIRHIREMLGEFAMNGFTCIVIDALYINDSGISELCDATVGVLADRSARIGRIIARDGITAEAAEKRLSVQKPDSYYRETCSYILENDSDVESFTAKCIKLFKEINEA